MLFTHIQEMILGLIQKLIYLKLTRYDIKIGHVDLVKSRVNTCNQTAISH